MTTTGQQTAAAADATAATPTLADGNTPAADNTAALAGTAAPSEVPESHLNDGDDKDTADDKDTTEMDTDVVEETPPETATAATARAKAAMTAFQKAMRDFSDGTAKCQSLVTSAAAQLVLEDNVPSEGPPPAAALSTVINEMVARDNFSAEWQDARTALTNAAGRVHTAQAEMAALLPRLAALPQPCTTHRRRSANGWAAPCQSTASRGLGQRESPPPRGRRSRSSPGGTRVCQPPGARSWAASGSPRSTL
ncbi:hypothetical protein RI054_11g55790 [Pseudoscourfieldia marina]